MMPYISVALRWQENFAGSKIINNK